MEQKISINENIWRAAIILITAALLLLTIYCLSQGITIVFMHLYYIPIVLLCYRYHRTGFYLSLLLSLTYLFMVMAFVWGDVTEILHACIRVAVFLGIAALVTYLSENLAAVHAELNKTVQVQQGIIHNANVWLAVLDGRGRILVWNRAAERLSGYMAADVIGRADIWKELYPDTEYRRKVTGAIRRIIAEKSYLDNYESEIRQKGGEKRTISWNTREIHEYGTGEKRYISIGLDITERKNAETELAEANVRLRELDRLKSMFIASMSHELRTPLNSIIGFTGILIKGMAGELNAEQKKQLGMVQDSARHLLGLINDVIDISKIEAGKIEAGISTFGLSDLMAEVKNSFREAAQAQDLYLEIPTPPEVTITSDQRRIKQVVMNLVSNAIKFTDVGVVTVTAVQDGQTVQIHVRDTGIGMSREDQENLFRPFYRVNVPGRLTEGTGLGLYLSIRLARFLGGDITVASEQNRGSEFVFEFPTVYVKQEDA